MIVIAGMSTQFRRRMQRVITTARTSSARLRNWARRRPSPNSPPSWNQLRSPHVIASPLFDLFNDTSTQGTTNDTFELSDTTPKQPTTNNNNNNNNNNDYLQPTSDRQAPIIQLFPNTASATYNNNNNNDDNDNNDDEFESAEEDNNNDNNNNNSNDNNNENNNENTAVIDHTSEYLGAAAAAAVVGRLRKPHPYYDARDSKGNFINWPRGEYSSDSEPDDNTLYDKRNNSYSTIASIHSKIS